VTIVESVQPEGIVEVNSDELCPNVVLWEAVVHAQVLDPCGKALFQPQVCPPILHTSTAAEYSK
jgi:hypothetical protein